MTKTETEIEKLKKFICIKEIKFIVKSYPTNKSQSHSKNPSPEFTTEFY